jgi:hypothetical protein
MKTSLTTAYQQINMTVNENGDAAMFIFPLNILGNATSDATSFASTINDSTFNPVSGTGGESIKNKGPLFPSTDAVE